MTKEVYENKLRSSEANLKLLENTSFILKGIEGFIYKEKGILSEVTLEIDGFEDELKELLTKYFKLRKNTISAVLKDERYEKSKSM